MRAAGHLVRAWHAHRRGELTRAQLRRALVPARMRLGRVLRRALACGERKPRALARDVLRLWGGLWAFAAHDGVEPTNNRAERALGETCRPQGRNVLHYLTDARTAARAGSAAPQLVAGH